MGKRSAKKIRDRYNDDIVTDPTDFTLKATDLLDHEVVKIGEIVGAVVAKWGRKPNTPENLEACRDELLYRAAEMGILCEFDPTPAFYGRPPILEIKGKFSTDPIHQYGFDHEQKRHEVLEAKKRN
jgi:hypothetical protein